jgi:hypothetical protein
MASLTPTPKQQFFDANGNPLVAGKVYTYAAGTTTPLATFTTGAGTVANTNPVILDSRGEANIWYSNGTSYKVALTDSADALIWTVDNIVTIGSMAFQNANAVAITGGTIGSGVTFNGKYACRYTWDGDTLTWTTTATQNMWSTGRARFVRLSDTRTQVVYSQRMETEMQVNALLAKVIAPIVNREIAKGVGGYLDRVKESLDKPA